MKIFAWTVTQDQRNSKLSQVLSAQLGISRRQLIRLKQQTGAALINGDPAFLDARLQPGDEVKIALAEHLEPVPPQAIPLDIIYEDADLLVLNKPTGLVSHPTKGYAQGTLPMPYPFTGNKGGRNSLPVWLLVWIKRHRAWFWWPRLPGVIIA